MTWTPPIPQDEIHTLLADLTPEERKRAQQSVRETVKGWPQSSAISPETARIFYRTARRKFLDERLRPESDAGLAEKLVDLHGDNLRFVPAWGWLFWDGRRWRRDDDGEIVRRAVATVRWIDELADKMDGTQRAHLKFFALRSESAWRIRAMVSLAEKEARVVAAPDQFDGDPYLFTVANGTLDLRTGALREHRREDLITRCADTEYVQGAHSQLWDGFLGSQVPDPEERAFLQKAIGSALVAPRDERMYFAAGPGNSGKGTFCSAMLAAIGEHGATTDPGVFTEGSREAQLELARLYGKRIAVLPELKRGERLALRILKQISGGDSVRAREHYRQAYDYKPQFTLIFSTNHVPQVDAADDGAWRRIVVIGFPRIVPEEERDPKLKETLCTDPEQRRAVLAWIVEGARLYFQDGARLKVPEVVREAGEEWKAANDPLRAFFSSECVLEPGGFAFSEDLQSAYKSWADAAEEQPVAWIEIAKWLSDHHCRRKRRRKAGNQLNGWEGVRLKTDLEYADQLAMEDDHA